MTTQTTERHVRLTIEGTAADCGDSGVLRVKYGLHRSVMVDTNHAGVTVEDLVPPRTWTDGDVVQHSDAGWTLTRTGGSWVSSRPNVERDYWTDEGVTQHLTDRDNGWGHLVVLRYQAGEQ